MNRTFFSFLIFFVILFLSAACNTSDQSADFSVEYEKFTLDNGLEVIFHKDDSNPVVAVALTIHVGSARELPGRTGFAHLFEHLLFLESENLGRGGLDQMSSRIGGSGANGSTSRDRTNYFQTVPKDALEKMIWAEADKMGYFINTVSSEVLEKEKQVVKNEKRQGVDNAPYGHTNFVIHQNLYPEGHPYSWQVIGSLDDLQAATLDDVRQFYNDWYVPNNATIVIAGDFDSDQAREWIHKYFDEIPRGDEIEPMDKKPANLSETKKLYHEDNYARLPELRMTWPGVEQYHPDSYPLQILTQLLADGKTAPLYQVLVEEEELTSGVNMFNSTSELAGEIGLRVRAYPNTDLNAVSEAIGSAFQKFETDGFSDRDLERVKAGIETSFYNGLTSVLGKAFQLAQYNIFAGDPGYINRDIQQILDVTREDVLRVYEQYVKGKHYVATSFVPRGQADLALESSEQAEVVVEEIVEGAEEVIIEPGDPDFERTPSSFDRTEEPPYGEAPQITPPNVWISELGNDMSVYGIEDFDLPLVHFDLRIRGGLLAEDPEKTGVSNLLAGVMTRGTENRTAAELEEAIDLLGARINVRSGRQEFMISGTTLSRNYEQTMELVEEILMEPRWDEREFELARQSVLSQIAQQSSNPNSIATAEFNTLLYGEGHILSFSSLGKEESVETITMDDLKAYYDEYIAPELSTFHVTGAISQNNLIRSLNGLNSRWENRGAEVINPEMPEPVTESQIYFYDVPNASQSVLRIGYLSLEETAEDYYPSTVMNYILGGGGFASRLTQQLREGQGYTYGIRSGFGGSDIPGPFTISSGVRSNVTLEATALIRDILADYPDTFSDTDLENTKSFLLKSNARAFETPGAKLGILRTMSGYGWSADYIREQEQVVEQITREEIQSLARQYANPDRMIYLVVGDARTQLSRLGDLGFGDPVLLND